MKNTLMVSKEDFDAWAKEKFVEYASTTIAARRNIRVRLVLSANLVGCFRVTKGSKILYEGDLFVAAQTYYNNEL